MERKSTISSQMRGKSELVARPDNRSPASGLYRESPEATSSTGGGASAIKDASQISLTSSRQSGNGKKKAKRHRSFLNGPAIATSRNEWVLGNDISKMMHLLIFYSIPFSTPDLKK